LCVTQEEGNEDLIDRGIVGLWPRDNMIVSPQPPRAPSVFAVAPNNEEDLLLHVPAAFQMRMGRADAPAGEVGELCGIFIAHKSDRWTLRDLPLGVGRR